jgi:sec-independent protein translocase protein TatC
MTLKEHLIEARRRLLFVIYAVAALSVVSYFLYPLFMTWLRRPYCEVAPHDCRFLVTSPLDPLTLRVKMSLAGGLVMSAPLGLWELWRFVTPGLKAHERRYALPFVLASLLFFVGGALLAYGVFPRALGWLRSVGGSALTSYYSPTEYLSLLVVMMVIFGVTFEFPVVLVALELAGVLKPATLLRRWRYSVIGIVFVSALVTPSSDPFSMFAMMVPLVVFYFLAIAVGRLAGK